MRATVLLGHLPLSVSPVLAAPLAGLLLAACSGSSGRASEFRIDSINVLEGQEWRINRRIEVVFTQPVDFATVSANTIHVADETGRAATGTFSLAPRPGGGVDARIVRFQPTCPTREDHADAGLQPFTTYRLSVLGSQVGGPALRSAGGEVLEQGALVTFHTPHTDDPLGLFLDTVAGPPKVRLRGQGGVPADAEAATHAEIGGQRVYFALDASQEGRLPDGVLLPLNHYSIAENRVAFVVHLDQPVGAAADNVSPAKAGVEYEEDGDWLPLLVEVELLANCTDTGAALRITPRGLLPQGRSLRVVLHPGFQDLTGDATESTSDRFARASIAPAGAANPVFPGVSNPEVDEVLEAFDVSGDDLRSLEDRSASFATPRAVWGGGELVAAFAFGGTGGPDGTFDWHLEPGTTVLDTSLDTIRGGLGGAETHTQSVVNGVIDVRDLVIPHGAQLVLVGPNPCTILATGDVLVLGEISARGGSSPGVSTLNTTFQPEPGGKGNAGGGDGGTGSFLTNVSTPRGGHGQGAFGAAAGGGRGGETSYFASNAHDDRRGAGGGGGRFGTDVRYDHDGQGATPLVRCQTLLGLDVERGAMGGPPAMGALSQSKRAQGGEPGPRPFLDDSDANDFHGVLLSTGGELVIGELDELHAGAGGGAGGDAVNSASFPLFPWDKGGDEKGAGGGGGGGGLAILALGRIVVGDGVMPASIAADGGDGGAGENPASGGFDRIGGGSGGGSGGHVVLSSATGIVVHGRAPSAGEWYRDTEGTVKHDPRTISATGGQGGAGNENRGGANEEGPVAWWCDRIPFDHFEGLADVPPRDLVCYDTVLPDLGDSDGGPVVGAGGDGGPGIVQLHVEDPALQLEFPTLQREQMLTYAEGLDVTPVCAPPPLGWRAPGETPDRMVPFFGKVSQGRSKWIPLGLARVGPNGPEQVVLRFRGTDAEGFVLRDGDLVDHLAPLVGPAPLGPEGSPPFVAADGQTVVFDASDMAEGQEVYLENTALLRNATVLLEDAADPGHFRHFAVASACFDATADRIACHVAPSEGSPESFVASGGVLASLVPHDLRVVTSGLADSYPESSSVRVRFDATKAGPDGLPDESAAAGFTADVEALNADAWDFFRFQVDFDLDAKNAGLTPATPRPGLDHLRVSFRF